MSLVGPRPLPADQVAAEILSCSRHGVVPAEVTGWWQTNGRSGDAEEALRLDLTYIENWSPTLDLYVLWKTFAAVIGRGSLLIGAGGRPTNERNRGAAISSACGSTQPATAARPRRSCAGPAVASPGTSASPP